MAAKYTYADEDIDGSPKTAPCRDSCVTASHDDAEFCATLLRHHLQDENAELGVVSEGTLLTPKTLRLREDICYGSIYSLVPNGDFISVLCV